MDSIEKRIELHLNHLQSSAALIVCSLRALVWSRGFRVRAMPCRLNSTVSRVTSKLKAELCAPSPTRKGGSTKIVPLPTRATEAAVTRTQLQTTLRILLHRVAGDWSR